jgi:prophage antirepressor-like protein
MTELRLLPFLFEGEGLIRVIDRDKAPWFIAADVCRQLDLKSTTMAVAPLDDDEKSTVSTLSSTEGGPDRIIISEGGLYTLILRSRAATTPGSVAHRFRKWVTSELLPAIRRGSDYHAPVIDAEEAITESPDGLKLRKVNTAARCFGERAGAQLWVKLGLEYVPAMAGTLSQGDLLDGPIAPADGTVVITVTPNGRGNGGVH